MQNNVLEYFETSNRKYQDKLLLSDDNNQITYEDVNKKVLTIQVKQSGQAL
ncbi:hypothetical protein LQZ18_04600 [Lachnospiraceae bacterium ZAX-1]